MPTDRNLLVGLMAVQLNFCTRDDLVEAMNRWALAKGRPLLELLPMPPDRRMLLDALVEEHLKLHDDDPQRSLAALAPAADLHALVSTGTVHQPPSDRTVIQTSLPQPSARYRILRPHAKGGLGEVFLAEDTELRRQVALKEIQQRHAANADSRGRFVMEAEVTGGLEHPNIVPVYGLGAYADGRPFYAMRFIRGDSLKEAIEKYHSPDANVSGSDRNLAFRNLLKRFVDVCNAVAFAHSRGILHRDLKPGNVMLGKYGETLVVDWGLAKNLASRDGDGAKTAEPRPNKTSGSYAETQAGSTVGTPPFMSPEQAAGHLDRLGPASDVYSLGATLYTILTGKLAFDGDLGDVLRQVEAGEFTPPCRVNPAVPAALNAITLKAMARQPEDRYASATALAEDIEHFLADESVTAYAEPATERLKRWARKHPGPVAGVAAALVVGVAGLASGLWFVNAEKNRTEQARQGEERQRLIAQDNERLANTARDQARQRYQLALDAFNDMVFGIQTKLEDRPATQALRKDLLENARKGLRTLLAEAERQGNPDETLAWAHIRMGDVEQVLGNSAAAEAEYKLAYGIAAGDNGSRTFGVCVGRLGDIALQLGRTDDAAQQFEKSRAIFERLAAEAPPDLQALGDHARSLARLGDVARLRGKTQEAHNQYALSLAVSRRCMEAHPRSAEAKRNLSAALERLGNAARLLGQLLPAQEYYAESLGLCKELAEAAPESVQARRDLATSYEKTGLILVLLERHDDGLKLYRQSLAILQKLADDDPTSTRTGRDLSVGLTRVGDVHWKVGRHAESLEWFEKARTIDQRLSDADPANAQLRRALAVSHDRLGDCHLKLGQPKKAFDQYESMRAINEGRVAADAGSAEAQRDLAVSFNKLGLASFDLGRVPQAFDYQKRSLAIRQKLADADPASAECAHSLLVSHYFLGQLFEKTGEFAKALGQYRLAMKAVEKLNKPDLFPAEVAELKKCITRCETAREVAPPPRK